MTDDVPLLSILCLTFNHERYVADALASFAVQRTSFVTEIVVADDCSNDNTLAVVEGFRDRFGARLRVLTTPVNLGVTRNFRRALSNCRGSYVALCEGDDHWRGVSKLQRQVDFLEAHPDHVLAFHDATLIGATARSDAVQLPRRLQRDASAAELIATRPISTVTVCFRNVLAMLPPELDHAPALDLCLWSLLGHHGGGRYMPEIEPAAYRVHDAGVFSMQDAPARYMMTAQSLLCLARVYARQGRPALAERLLLEAAVTAGRRLRFAGAMTLTAVTPLWFVARSLRAGWFALTRRERA